MLVKSKVISILDNKKKKKGENYDKEKDNNHDGSCILLDSSSNVYDDRLWQ